MDQLSLYLKKNELSYDDFGALIGCSGTSVYRYAVGLRIPAPRVMRRIIEVTQGELSANHFYPSHSPISHDQAVSSHENSREDFA